IGAVDGCNEFPIRRKTHPRESWRSTECLDREMVTGSNQLSEQRTPQDEYGNTKHPHGKRIYASLPVFREKNFRPPIGRASYEVRQPCLRKAQLSAPACAQHFRFCPTTDCRY